MKNFTMAVDAAIFDLDGTLIDSFEPYFMITEEILKRLKVPPVARNVLLQQMKDGMGGWRDLFPSESESRKKQLAQEAGTLYKKLAPSMFRENLKMIPGVAETLKQIAAKGIKIGLVTLTHLQYLDDKLYPLKNVGVADLIDVSICIEDTPRVKPAPDSLLKCAERMNVSPDTSVYIGDSDIDIQAGRAAGMKTIGVLTGMDTHKTLINEGPDMIVDSVADLLKIIQSVTLRNSLAV